MSNSGDNRRYARFEMLEYALVYFEGRSEPIRAVVVDIGLGGLQLRTRSILPVGETCYIQVARSNGTTMDLRGEVRHSNPLPDSDICASGFRFVPTTHEERIAIASYVHDVFLRQGELAAHEIRLDL